MTLTGSACLNSYPANRTACLNVEALICSIYVGHAMRPTSIDYFSQLRFVASHNCLLLIVYEIEPRGAERKRANETWTKRFFQGLCVKRKSTCSMLGTARALKIDLPEWHGAPVVSLTVKIGTRLRSESVKKRNFNRYNDLANTFFL